MNKKKSDELVIEWVGPVKPRKEEKPGPCSEGKESEARSQEKKSDLANFEVSLLNY